jgi:hypothetical protein
MNYILHIATALLALLYLAKDWEGHKKSWRRLVVLGLIFLIGTGGIFNTYYTNKRIDLQHDNDQKRIAGLKEAVDIANKNVTGGNSYPQIRIGFDSGNPGSVPLFATTQKTDTATSFDYVITQVADEDSCLFRKGGTVISRGTTGPMLPRIPVIIPDRLTPSKTETSTYCILMTAKNGGFTEILKLSPNADKLRFAWMYTILDGSNVIVANEKFPY